MWRLPLALVPLLLTGAEWPVFRGPNSSGLSPEKGLPSEFGPNKNVVWKTPLPQGASSPVFTGDRIFLTAFEENRLQTYAIARADGRILWRREVLAGRAEALHPLNDRASATPATDGKNVYSFFGDFGLVAYSAEGQERWRLPLGPFTNLHGMGASPVLARGQLIMLCDQNNDSYLLAVDAATGRVRWKTPRPEVTHGFSTPVIWRDELIVPGAYLLAGYSVNTGEKLWWVRGLSWQPKSAPVVSGDVLYFNGWAPGGDSGQQYDLPEWERVLRECDANHNGAIEQSELPKEWQPTGSWGAVDLDRDGVLNQRDWYFFRARRAARNSMMAVKLGGKGDVTASHILWSFSKSLPDVPTPLLYKGVLYLFRTGGIATSLNPENGEVFKQERLMPALEGYYSSPIGADDKVYIASEQGKVLVLKAARQWEILTVNDMEDPIYATPAVGDGRLYLRTRHTLYCFASK